MQSRSIFILAALLFILSATPALAANPDILNAGVVQDVWYSSVDVYDGETTRLYGGIYNHSSTSFSGTAIFYIDEKEGKKIPFTSKPDDLLEVNDSWKAVAGDHKIRLKITSVNTLISKESEEVTLSVKKKVTTETVKEKATNIATKVVDSIDLLSNDLAQKIESYKKPERAVMKSSPLLTKLSVVKPTDIKAQVALVLDSIEKFPVFNSILNLLALIVRHWKIALVGLVCLIVLYKFFSVRK